MKKKKKMACGQAHPKPRCITTKKKKGMTINHMTAIPTQDRSTHELHPQIHHDNYKSQHRKANYMVFGIYYMWAVTALPYQHRISSRDLSMKKLGILRTEMIFALPRCLLL